MAAKDLTITGKTVTEIAFEYDFGCLDSFSRSFRKYYNISPSQFRKNNYQLNSVNSIAVTRVAESEDIKMEPKIVNKKEMYVVGVIEKVKENVNILENHMKLKKQFIQKSLDNFPEFVKNRKDGSYLELYMFPDETEVEYEGYMLAFVGTEVENLDYIPKGMVGRVIGKQKYAKYSINGNLAVLIGETYDQFEKWLPTSGYMFCRGATIEKYHDAFVNLTDKNSRLDIFLPIERVLIDYSQVVTMPNEFECYYYRAVGSADKWNDVKKEAFTVMLDWAEKNGLIHDGKVKLFDFNYTENGIFYYEVFYRKDDTESDLSDDNVKIKIQNGGTFLTVATIHKKLVPTANQLSNFIAKSVEFDFTSGYWFEEYEIEDKKLTLNTPVTIYGRVS